MKFRVPQSTGGSMHMTMATGSRRGKIVLLVALFTAVSIMVPLWAAGTAPVQKTLNGCVAGGTFYSITRDAQTGKPVKAYAIRIEGSPDLIPHEGKRLAMTGLLFPGDRFVLDKGSRPVDTGTCEDEEIRVIRKELIILYRVAGYKAAQKKDFDEALRLTNQALTMDPNLCGTYVDRALVYNLKGDFTAGAADIRRVRDGACVDPQGLNHLIVQEIGETLEKAGRKSDAVDLYYMGLNACDSDMCREAIENSLRRAMAR
ncbi:MAG: hypothetical protein ABIN58_06735 [candidate division WOR-3 bacterium]